MTEADHVEDATATGAATAAVEPAPRTCAGCGNTPVSPRHAHTVYPNLGAEKAEAVEKALAAGMWICVHCPAVIGSDGRPAGGEDA